MKVGDPYPQFIETAVADLAPQSVLSFQVYDEDVAFDDLMFECTMKGLRARDVEIGASCRSDLASGGFGSITAGLTHP